MSRLVCRIGRLGRVRDWLAKRFSYVRSWKLLADEGSGRWRPERGAALLAFADYRQITLGLPGARHEGPRRDEGAATKCDAKHVCRW